MSFPTQHSQETDLPYANLENTMPPKNSEDISESTMLHLLAYRLEILEKQLHEIEKKLDDTEELKQRGRGAFWMFMAAAGTASAIVTNFGHIKSWLLYALNQSPK